ncbi:hypothetical protein, partial [Almyronema epifaneia]
TYQKRLTENLFGLPSLALKNIKLPEGICLRKPAITVMNLLITREGSGQKQERSVSSFSL